MIITPEMDVAVRYQSHLPALLACCAVTTGPVLELGCGHFSTPHLHALCGALKRLLVSVESDEEWRAEFITKYGNGFNHAFRSEVMDTGSVRWGVAFIDHSPGGANRAVAFRALIDVSEFVVVHDAQKDAENFQHIEPMLAGLNWHLCTSYFPHTLIASKTRQIPEVLIGM